MRTDSSARREEDELSPEIKARIKEFARTLPGKSHYEVLEVSPEADEGEIRAAFFSLSKQFHPDRYFRKRLGPYEQLLGEIYKRVLVAHEVLADPEQRAAYDRRRSASEGAASGTPSGSLRARSGSRPSALERLRCQIESGQDKARKHFEEALAQRGQGDVVRAVSLIRLAMAFDPREPEYSEALAELLPAANSEQATALRVQAERLLELGDRREAAPLFEEAFRLLPTDGREAFRVARLWQELGEAERALELAEHAVRLEEEDPEPRKLLARLYKAAGRAREARREFQRAWELDPLDREVKAELARGRP